MAEYSTSFSSGIDLGAHKSTDWASRPEWLAAALSGENLDA